MASSPARCASLSLALATCIIGGVAPTARAQHLSDANIAALIDEANAGDSALGAAALPKLTDRGPRDFARLMEGEHHALHVEGLDVERAEHITPELPSPDPFRPAVDAERETLSAMPKGRAYDSTYISHEVAIHRAVIHWVGGHLPANAAYRRYVSAAGPVLQKHLRDAEAIQRRMARHAK